MDWEKSLVDSLAITTFFRVSDEPVNGHFWYDAEGNETSDPEKVIRKEAEQFPRWRIAKSSQEFRLVYDREFARTGLEISDENHALFIRTLKKHVNELIEKHVSNREYTITDFQILSVAESFLNYLNPHKMANPRPMTNLAEEVNAKKIDSLPYDIAQYRFFSFDNAIKIKYHYDPSDDPEAYHKFVFKHENLQLIIHFEKEFLQSDEGNVTLLLDKQYERTEIMGTPQDIWLDNVEKIISHHGLLKRPDYAKHDTVKLWFRNRRAALQKETPDVPFIGELFHRNLNINQIVTDAYYRLVRQPGSRAEVSEAYVGPLNHYYSPYQRSYYGAYINMGTVGLLEMYIKDKMPPYDQVKDQAIEQGLKEYARGFKLGYYDFDKEMLEKNPFQEPSHKARIIFDFVTGRFQGIATLPITHGRSDGNYLAGWKDAGHEEGKLYRAWYLILENHTLFESLFKKLQYKGAKPNLSVDEVAITRFFNNEPVNRENHNEIAASYGHTSGEKLYQRYNWYASTANRKAKEDTPKKMLNKIKRFEAVLPHIRQENQQKIIAEINDLKQLADA